MNSLPALTRSARVARTSQAALTPAGGAAVGSIILLLALGATAFSHEHVSSRAHYLGNEAVMVERGDTKIVFDPLFREDYGQYQRVPAEIEAALMAGTAPFDGIDAVFISHYHDDHFDPALMLDYLEKRARLLDRLDRDRVNLAGEPVLAVYNGPWTPSFMRRNEVMVDIEVAN